MLKGVAKRRGGSNKKEVLKTKKKVKPNPENGNIPNKNKKLDLDDEEILSEEADSVPGDDYDGEDRNNRAGDPYSAGYDDEEEKETADQKRRRLAKEVIEKAKAAKREKIEQDEFFLSEGVHRDEEDDVTKILQLEHVKKKYYGIISPRKRKFKESSIELRTSLEARNYEIDIHSFKGHTKCITCLEVHSSGQYLYSASKDGSLIKWDLNEGKKAVLNLGAYDKDDRSVAREILCMSLSFDDKYLVTGGSDSIVRLWDAKNLQLIDTFKGHKDAILGIKFKNYSMEFCSVGADRVLKLWDASEQAYIDTYYGHKAIVNSIDAIGEHVITCGFDKQVIYWKTEDESQLLYKGGDYSLDVIRSLTPKFFVTGSQSGDISMWATNKNKPIYEINNAHENCWITALGSYYNSDLFASGAYNNRLNFYKADIENRNFEKCFELPAEGIINDIKFSANFVATCEGDEMRLGRWVTQKAKNRIKLYRFK